MKTKENILAKLRKKRGLTQEQLAIFSGVKLERIKAYEQGRTEIRKARAGTLFLLAQRLKCSMLELMEYETKSNQKLIRSKQRKCKNQILRSLPL